MLAASNSMKFVIASLYEVHNFHACIGPSSYLWLVVSQSWGCEQTLCSNSLIDLQLDTNLKRNKIMNDFKVKKFGR